MVQMKSKNKMHTLQNMGS